MNTVRVWYVSVFLFWAGAAHAHMAPVYANDITLTVDGDRLTARIDAAGPWWVTDVFHDDEPHAAHWTDSLRDEAKTYFDSHFVLQADGQPLTSQWISHRYVHEVWKYYLGSRLRMEFCYSLPPHAQVLSGQATFYKEDLSNRLHPLPGLMMEFFSRLHSAGGKRGEWVVPIEQPAFSIPITELRRTAAQRWKANFLEGFAYSFTDPGLLLLLMAGYWLCFARQLKKGMNYLSPLILFLIATDIAGHFEGWAIGLAALFLLAIPLNELAARLYFQQLRHESAAQAERLFASHQHFIGGVILLISLVSLAQKGFHS